MAGMPQGGQYSQGLCEIKGGHICQVQLKQPEKDQICNDESGCVSICNQILLASYFHLQNYGTSHLDFFHSSTLKIYSPISRIPRATSHVLTIAVLTSSVRPAVLLAFVCQFLKKDTLPLYLCSCLLWRLLLYPLHTLSIWSLALWTSWVWLKVWIILQGMLDLESEVKCMSHSLFYFLWPCNEHLGVVW